MEAFFSGFKVVLSFHYILYMFAGVALGSVLAFLPGLSCGLGIALLLPFTYSMDALDALVLLMSIYSGGCFAGSISAIMLNTPGAPANVATTLDGYPMAKNGEPERAMGIALMSSIVGGLVGATCLLLVAAPMANFSLKFGPGEMFIVAFFGLSVVGSLSEDVIKSLFAGLVGILMGTIGISTTGAFRGTMGNMYLFEGIPLIPSLIGLIAFPELINLLRKSLPRDTSGRKNDIKKIVKGMWEALTHPIRVVLCAIVGVVVGLIPAAGSSVAGFLAYNQSKQWSKTPERFGKGIAEGIIAPEAANNASEGGALATMFVLGIPGSGATAILMGALTLQGWVPGPRMFTQHMETIYMSFSSLFLQQLVMGLLGVLLCWGGSRFLKMPSKYLVPLMMTLTILGSFSNRYTLFDAGLLLVFGLIGWFMKESGYPPISMLLGIILGGTADAECIRVLQSFDHFTDIFQRPIVIVLSVVTVLCIVLPILLKARREKNKKRG